MSALPIDILGGSPLDVAAGGGITGGAAAPSSASGGAFGDININRAKNGFFPLVIGGAVILGAVWLLRQK